MREKVEYSDDYVSGDVVLYTYTNDNWEEVKVRLRLCSKVVNGYVRSLYPNDDFEGYLAVPHEDENLPKADIEMHALPEGCSPPVVEWGFVPKKNLMLVNADFCYPTIDELDSISFVKRGLCPRCGHRGQWHGMVCSCPWHGYFLG